MADAIEPHPNNPRTVDPQRARDLEVLYDGGLYVQGDPSAGWSLARMTWCGEENQVGMRWNGAAGITHGAPVEAGRPAWFILPAGLAKIILDEYEKSPQVSPGAASLGRHVMAHVYEGQPDKRQSDDPTVSVSRFRPRYRALTDDEKALHDALKAKAAELEELILMVRAGRERALALTDLEVSIMWAVKALTL